MLFSGGKDSCYALYKAMEKEQVVCLISVLSENKESYMFHTPNIHLVRLQAKAIGLPIIEVTTKGKKEKELLDLKDAIFKAKNTYKIEGIVSGAIASVYQATRIQKICNELGLWCFNPLWQKNQLELLDEIVRLKFKVIVSGIFAYPFTEEWLGRMIDKNSVKELEMLYRSHKINPCGEGGEFETTVLDAPFFEKEVLIKDYSLCYTRYSGTLSINNAVLVKK